MTQTRGMHGRSLAPGAQFMNAAGGRAFLVKTLPYVTNVTRQGATLRSPEPFVGRYQIEGRATSGAVAVKSPHPKSASISSGGSIVAVRDHLTSWSGGSKIFLCACRTASLQINSKTPYSDTEALSAQSPFESPLNGHSRTRRICRRTGIG